MNNYMKIAIDSAKKTESDIPVGAVIVRNNEVICSSYNTKEVDKDVTSHAEILALRKASKIIGDWRLNDCEMYVTLEPCPMCGWAIIQSRLKALYYGSKDFNYGAFSKFGIDKTSLNVTNIYSGIMEDECDMLLKNFFDKIRNK